MRCCIADPSSVRCAVSTAETWRPAARATTSEFGNPNERRIAGGGKMSRILYVARNHLNPDTDCAGSVACTFLAKYVTSGPPIHIVDVADVENAELLIQGTPTLVEDTGDTYAGFDAFKKIFLLTREGGTKGRVRFAESINAEKKPRDTKEEDDDEDAWVGGMGGDDSEFDEGRKLTAQDLARAAEQRKQSTSLPTHPTGSGDRNIEAITAMKD